MVGFDESKNDTLLPVKNHVYPKFYCVYLLQSETKSGSFYIGSTPDPVRRLRQHNGELIKGAFRTRRTGCRPWKMVLVVSNFPSKIAALQFEHSFQHPYKTRHIQAEERVSKNAQSARSLHQKLANVRLLVSSSFFRRMCLEVRIFDENVHQSWESNKYGIAIPYYTEAIKLDFNKFFGTQELEPGEGAANLRQINKQEHDYFEVCKEKLLVDTHNCFICNQLVEFLLSPDHEIFQGNRKVAKFFPQEILAAICYHCYTVYHLPCLAKMFLGEQELIPLEGQCIKCTKDLNWSRICKCSTLLREYALKD